jgi:hypothetical protein
VRFKKGVRNPLRAFRIFEAPPAALLFLAERFLSAACLGRSACEAHAPIRIILGRDLDADAVYFLRVVVEAFRLRLRPFVSALTR